MYVRVPTLSSMESHRWTAYLIMSGGLLYLLRPALPTAFPTMWVFVATGYVLVGILLGGPRFLFSKRTPFWWASLVALGLAALFVAFQLHTLLESRPELTLQDTTFYLTNRRVLVTVAFPFFLPLGVSRRRPEAVIASLVIVLPFLLSIIQAFLVLPANTEWGRGASLFFNLFWLFTTTILGVPLLLYGRGLRNGPSPLRHGFVRTLNQRS